MIEVKSVSKTIKNKEILSNINLKIEDGKGYLLRGHNGSGKTMILRLLCGLIKPTTGTVSMDRDLSFGVVIENPSFIENQSAIYNLKYLAGINDKINNDEILDALRQVNLYEHRNEKVSRYSLGMKQRLAICQAIMEYPDVILLDEPFNALDDENYNRVMEILLKLKSEGKTIVVAAHETELVEQPIFDELIVLSNGKIKD